MRTPTRNCNFIKNYDIKTFESTLTINKNFETIKFVETNKINSFMKKYKFLHIGVVQVIVMSHPWSTP